MIRFTVKCQNCNIKEQYEKYGARYFDLRVKFDNDGNMTITHGKVVFNFEKTAILDDLTWLNDKRDVFVRVLYDVRSNAEYSEIGAKYFREWCEYLEKTFTDITFVGGNPTYSPKIEYDFKNYVSVDGKYASEMPPRIIDDWLPVLYAKLHNKTNIKVGTDKDVLLIDFVDIC